MDLTTTYLGLKLRTPLVVSACTLSEEVKNIERMEKAGASAVVLYSLFEEQIRKEQEQFDQYLNYGTESFAEALSYFPDPGIFKAGIAKYLEHIRNAKKAVKIPIIASLNGASSGGWTGFAKKIEDAGADALELNIYFLPSDMNVSGAQVENTYVEILRAVKSTVKIPVAVKLSPFFSNTANMAKRMVDAGANGLVLFNRFYQPDIDLDAMEITPKLLLSSAYDLRLPLCWIGMLYGRIKTDFASTSGVQTPEDAVKMLLVGANVTMLCATLYRNGIDHIRTIEKALEVWMTEKGYHSVSQMIGSMSQAKSANPTAFERVQYMRTIKTISPIL